MHLLVAVEGTKILATVVTQVVQYPQKVALRVVLVAGVGAKKWENPLRDLLLVGARNVGATSIEALCRKGWIRFLAKYPGVRLQYYMLVEDI